MKSVLIVSVLALALPYVLALTPDVAKEYANELSDLKVVIYEASFPYPRNPDHGKVLDRLVWSEMNGKWMSDEVQDTYIKGCVSDWCTQKRCVVSRQDLKRDSESPFPVSIGIDYDSADLNWVRLHNLCVYQSRLDGVTIPPPHPARPENDVDAA